MENKDKNALAIVSLILGILAIGSSFIPIVNNASIIIGIIGIVLAVIPLIKNQSKALAIGGLVLCALAVIISFALQASWGKELDKVSKDLDQSIKDSDGSNTDKILKNDVDVKIGNFEVTTDEYGINETKVVVTVTNKAKSKASYDIHIEAVDSNGNRIEDDYVYASNLAAGQTQEVKIFGFIEDEKLEAMKNATIKIVDISK